MISAMRSLPSAFSSAYTSRPASIASPTLYAMRTAGEPMSSSSLLLPAASSGVLMPMHDARLLGRGRDVLKISTTFADRRSRASSFF